MSPKGKEARMGEGNVGCYLLKCLRHCMYYIVGEVQTVDPVSHWILILENGAIGNAGAMTKLSDVRMRGEKIIYVHLTVVVFDGCWGEDTMGAAFSIKGSSTSFSFVWVMKGLEFCDVFITLDVPSSSTAMVDEEPHMNAGSSVVNRCGCIMNER
jgi:hypothetical protein